jgi:hypothetical protein
VAAAAKTTPRQRRGKSTPPRKMFMPYEPGAITVVQPPAELAHLDGDELFEALTDAEAFERATGHAPAKWYQPRFFAEIGRSEGRFKAWMSNYYAVTDRNVDPATIDDRIMEAPDGYDMRSPWWWETTARAWAIQEKLMTRGGVMVPHKPSGRPPGTPDSRPRTRTATMKAGALDVLRSYEELIAGGASIAQAKAKLAETQKLSEKQVARRLTAGREMRAAGVREITPEMTPAERAEVMVLMVRLLMADGRRKHEGNARAEVATRLGVTREEVDAAIDGAPAAMTRAEVGELAAGAAADIAARARDREAEQP